MRSVLLLLLVAAPASAQLSLSRQVVGDVAFVVRADTTGACAGSDTSLFPRHDLAPDEACTWLQWMVVEHRGVAVDSVGSAWVWLGAPMDTLAGAAAASGGPFPVVRAVPAGAVRDLTADGVPEVLVGTYSSGMHCCTTYWVLSLTDDGPQLLQRLDAGDSDVTVTDRDADGQPELELVDVTFAYWNESFAGSPFPRVVLAWNGERLAASPDHMRAPPPADLDARAARVRADGAWAARRFPPSAYWGALLELVSTGQPAAAARFAESAWAGDAVGRGVFMRWFRETLFRSPFADGYEALAGDWLFALPDG